jgi:hypothetical protein
MRGWDCPARSDYHGGEEKRVPGVRPSMIFNRGSRPVLRQVLAAGIAIGLVVLAYAMRFPNVGGILVLSTLYVAIWSLLKSGAFSASWLQRQSSFSIENAMLLEFAKAMICAGIGVDSLAAFRVSRGFVAWSDLTAVVLLTWVTVWAAGTCLFLVRWFAATLIARR